MKINIKTVANAKFSVDVEPSSTIQALQAQIEQTQPTYLVSGQKLIHKGKVAQNNKTLDELGIKEGEFLVIMYTQPVEREQPKDKPVEVPQKVETTSSPVNNSPNPPPTHTHSPSPVSNNTSSNPNTNTNTSSNTTGPSAELKRLVAEIKAMDLGFTDEQIEKQLRRAFLNPDRALQYLFDDPNGGSSAPTGAVNEEADIAPQGGDGPNISNPDEYIINMLSPILRGPQFDPLRQQISTNPQAASGLIIQLAQSLSSVNPQLGQIIASRPELLIRALFGNAVPSTGGGRGGARDDRVRIMLTPEQAKDIEQLIEISGCSKQDVLEAFLACDKQKDIAISYLFDRKANHDLLTEHIKSEEEKQVIETSNQPPTTTTPPPATNSTSPPAPLPPNTNNTGSGNTGPKPGDDKSGGGSGTGGGSGNNSQPPGDDDDDIFS